MYIFLIVLIIVIILFLYSSLVLAKWADNTHKFDK